MHKRTMHPKARVATLTLYTNAKSCIVKIPFKENFRGQNHERKQEYWTNMGIEMPSCA